MSDPWQKRLQTLFHLNERCNDCLFSHLQEVMNNYYKNLGKRWVYFRIPGRLAKFHASKDTVGLSRFCDLRFRTLKICENSKNQVWRRGILAIFTKTILVKRWDQIVRQKVVILLVASYVLMFWMVQIESYQAEAKNVMHNS